MENAKKNLVFHFGVGRQGSFYQVEYVKCEICGYTCSHKGNVNKHVASVHGKKKPFKCEICQFPFSEKGNMNKHVALVHVGK